MRAPTAEEREFLEQIQTALPLMSEREQGETLVALEELDKRRIADTRRASLLEFIQAVDEDYIVGNHHKRLASLLEDMAYGRTRVDSDHVLDRLTVSIGPRFGKSMITSIYFPAWFIGNFPKKKIMLVSHTADLAVDFGRKVRNIVNSEAYQLIFPGVELAADSKSAGRWDTNHGGSFYAAGIGSALAGRGGDFICQCERTVIKCRTGDKKIKDVKVGDEVLGFGGFNRVLKVMRTSSPVVINVNSSRATPGHPFWTFNRGWIVADALTSHDLFDTINALQYIGMYYERFKTWQQNTRTHVTKWRDIFIAHVQQLDYDAPAVQQPERRQLSLVRRARDKMLRALGGICELLAGYGGTPGWVNTGQGGPQRGLHAGELPVGGRHGASTEPSWRGEDNSLWQNTVTCSVGAGDRSDARYDQAPHIQNGNAPGRSIEGAADELGAAPRSTSEFRWLKRAGFWLFSRSGAGDPGETGVIVGCAKAFFSSRVCGLLLGVRTAEISRGCGSSIQFYNMHVSDSNTFYANSWMTHNCIDDPHNEGEILAGNLDVFDKAYDWFRYGLRTRLQAGGRIAIVATRWAQNDLIGQLLSNMVKSSASDQWEVVEFPAILNEGDKKREKSLWPEMWTLDSLKRTRASMPPFQWHAQYQQNPTGEHAALLPKKWWRKWKEDKPPECTYIIMSLDTAAEKNNRADFTALTTWGVFDYVDPGGDGVEHSHIMLLDAVNERMEYPELKKMTLRKWEEFDPDWFIVEKKNSGSALYQEMRTNGLPVQEFTPNRKTGDKVARINAITDIFSSGMVWYPVGHRWAEEVVDQAAAFPGGKHDDLVDSLSMAITRFRTGGFIRLPSDRIWDDDEDFQPVQANYY